MKKVLTVVLSLMLTFTFLFGEELKINDNPFQVKVLQSSSNETVIEYSFGSFSRKEIQIDGKTYYNLSLSNESRLMEKGNPALPKIARSIIIPNDKNVEISVMESEYVEYNFTVAPSKGKILRNIDPATVPYEFSDIYQQDQFYPENISYTGSPYIMRDFRGTVINVLPFSYNPKQQILRVYTKVVVSAKYVGFGEINVKMENTSGYNSYFSGLYKNHFINFEETKYEPVDDQGRIIVITYDDFADAMAPYVAWKNQKGVQCDMYNLSEIGSTANDIKTFIQAEYDAANGLTFVQLVGDDAQMPSFSESGGASDPTYALLEGDDSYPEIFIGRFSAETVAELETQVARTVFYERDLNNGEWLAKGTGIASNQGPGDDDEYDNEHQDVIRQKLLDYGYTEVDQIYDPEANQAMVAAALNEGRGIVNYTGHGSDISWSSSSFSVSDVNALTNDYMLPFINSVACVNGNYVGQTCFAEAWVRATNGSTGAPTGAVAIYASSINQSWAPPMAAQDDAIDIIIADSKSSLGGLWYNSSCQMLDEYDDQAMYKTWHIFGDVSLLYKSKEPLAIAPEYNDAIFVGLTSFEVTVPGQENSLVGISMNDELLGSAYTDETGLAVVNFDNPVSEVGTATITVTGHNLQTVVSDVLVIVPANVAMDPDTITINTETAVTVTVTDTAGVGMEGVNIWAE
ncbi:MAG: hypothetical protein KAR38_09575, partial [Calditrichia bacterium]|nr:hypothetical protein [Calditrichia bacterium]